MLGRVLFVVNPVATARSWPRLARYLNGMGLEFDVAFTTGPGAAVDLACDALGNGRTTIVAVCGDSTVNEVVNGFFVGGEPLNHRARLGIVPLGSGNDLSRSLGLPKGEAALTRLLGSPRSLDVGVARFENSQGLEERRYFLNVAATGLVAEVTQRVGSGHKRLGVF